MSDSLKGLGILARALLDAEAEVEDAEAHLKACKEKARLLREETLPGLMQELGLEQVKIDTGQKVTVKQDVHLQIANHQKPAAYQWLDDNGFGSLIKTAVITPFSRADIEHARALFKQLREAGHTTELKMDVHYQTLKAWLREQIAEGNEVPLDLFGARPIFVAKVK